MAESQTRKPIPGYEGIYEVDDLGRVFSLGRVVRNGRQIVKPAEIRPITHKWHGYSVVNLANDGKVKQHRLHRIVAECFIPNPESKPTVNHKSGVKSDNRVVNLEWATPREQGAHASKMGLCASGERNGGCKVRDSDYVEGIARVLSGELMGDVAHSLGVKRYALTRAAYRLGFEKEWRREALLRKSMAAFKRFHGG